MKTSLEACREALREIEVLGIDEDMPAEHYQMALRRLESLFAELRTYRELVIDWTIETIPDQVFMPLIVALGAYCARPFGKPVSEAEKRRTVAELRAALVLDDREDLRPEGEVKRAAFM